jgi:large subunit ribosomal protein L23
MMIDLVKYPALTEKSVRLMDTNQYTFDVDLRLTKPQIRRLIEHLFQVQVTSVNTHRPPRRRRRLGYTLGNKASYKRVIVTIKRGQSIQVLPAGTGAAA